MTSPQLQCIACSDVDGFEVSLPAGLKQCMENANATWPTSSKAEARVVENGLKGIDTLLGVDAPLSSSSSSSEPSIDTGALHWQVMGQLHSIGQGLTLLSATSRW